LLPALPADRKLTALVVWAASPVVRVRRKAALLPQLQASGASLIGNPSAAAV